MPFYRFVIDSPMPPQLALATVQTLVRKPPTFWASLKSSFSFRINSDQPFLGTVGPDSFRIRREIRGRNSFLPLVWGKVFPDRLGSRVTITMFLQPMTALFMLFWFSMIGIGLYRELRSTNNPFNTESLISIGMILFGIGLVLFGFIPEVIKAKRILISTLKAECA